MLRSEELRGRDSQLGNLENREKTWIPEDSQESRALK